MRRAAGHVSREIGAWCALAITTARSGAILLAHDRASAGAASDLEPRNVAYGRTRPAGGRRRPSPRPSQSPTGASSPAWTGRAESRGFRRARSVTSSSWYLPSVPNRHNRIDRCHISNHGVCSEGDTQGCSILTTARDTGGGQITGAPNALPSTHSRNAYRARSTDAARRSGTQNGGSCPAPGPVTT